MVAIPFPLSTAPGERPQEGGGRLVNAMAEELGPGARAKTVLKRAPGLRSFANSTGPVRCRGFLEIGDTLLVARDNRIEIVTRAGVVTDLGRLDGTGPVMFARNNKRPVPDILAVSAEGCFVISLSAAPTAFSDADLPAPNSVCAIDNYFVWTVPDGRAFASGLNDTTVSSLDYAEAGSRSDGLSRAIPFRGELLLCGARSIEPWVNTGEATGFPFTVNKGAVIPRGLLGPHAISGHEEGFANALLFVGDDGIVYRLDGYQPVRVSTHALERRIAAVADPTTLLAFSFMSVGHAFWALKCADWCWVHDLTTGQWHERASHGSPTWRAEHAVQAFGKWLLGDAATGTIWQADHTYYREGADPLVWTVESAQMAGFPGRVAVPAAHFDFVGAVGVASGASPNETNPQVSISWSDDGGYTWSNELLRALGAEGVPDARVSVHRTGMTGRQGRQWRLSVSDPVHVGLIQGAMDVRTRAP